MFSTSSLRNKLSLGVSVLVFTSALITAWATSLVLGEYYQGVLGRADSSRSGSFATRADVGAQKNTLTGPSVAPQGARPPPIRADARLSGSIPWRSLVDESLPALVLGGVALTLLLTAGWAAGASITRRLGALTVVVERVAGGDMAVPVKIRGRDEIALLGRALGRMLIELRRRVDCATESEQQLRLAVSGSDACLWEWEVASGGLHFSSQVAEVLDCREEALPQVFGEWLARVHPEDRERIGRELHAQLDRQTPFRSEFRLQSAEGKIRWIVASGRVQRDAHGKPLRMAGSLIDVSAHRQESERLRASLDQFRTVVECLPDMVQFKGRDGRCELVNAIGLQVFEIGEEAWIGRTDVELSQLYPRYQHVFLTSHHNDQAAWALGERHEVEERLVDLEGHSRVFEVTRIPLQEGSETPVGMVIVRRDITQRRRAEEALFREKERAQVTLESIGDGVVTTDVRGTIDYMNPVAERLTGWQSEQARGKALPLILEIIDEADRHPVGNPVDPPLQDGLTIELADPILLVNHLGEEYFIDVTAAPIRTRDERIIGAVVVFRDITERRNLMRRLSHRASHDALTGLINRYEFERRLKELLKEGPGSAASYLCYMDLDQFKIINDTCGHAAGDELLRDLASVVRRQTRRNDVLARLGGDEFALLLEDCPLERATQIAEKLRRAVSNYRYTWEDRSFSVGVSIGLVPVRGHGRGVAQVLSAADEACYLAKEKGRDRVHVSAPDDEEVLQRRGEMQWATRLKQAFDEDAFVLFAQPIVALGSEAGPARHYEILVRMIDNEGQIIAPGAFLPAAERYGLVSLLDQWVVRHAIAEVAQVLQTGVPIETVSVNLCGASLGEQSVLDLIQGLLKEYGLGPELFCFEITETVAIANFNEAMHFIQELKRLGCRFSLDDFGSGFSSFSYLKTLPVDYLKIDGSFVRQMVGNANDAAMVEAINHIGHVMGLKTIAEFVGDERTVEMLRTIGVDFGQGFYLGKPAPFAQVYTPVLH